VLFSGSMSREMERNHTLDQRTATAGEADRATDREMDALNRRVWSTATVLKAFGDDASPRTEWWTDPGERSAILSVADAVRGRPVLEVGVGGGRLVPILRLLTTEYIGIDYTPEMVALCHRLHPGVDVRLGDARDLSDFADDAFDLVVFTFNGLDAIDHSDRSVALAEMRRVLRPGGLLIYSSHNMDGPCFRARPWHRAGAPQRSSWPISYRLMRWGGEIALHPASFPQSVRNWFRLHRLGHVAESWAIAPVEAHDFDLLIHFTTYAGTREELAQVGLELVDAFDAERGRSVTSQSDTRDIRYFHFIARAPIDPIAPRFEAPSSAL
jgi:SAM-dependent methyltransferase